MDCRIKSGNDGTEIRSRDATHLVIPDRRVAASPESITIIFAEYSLQDRDYGFRARALSAPRNDDAHLVLAAH
jgi:hypothetical protein